MHFTKPFKSSPHSLPSPDGRYVATLLPSSIVVRSVTSLDIVRSVKLPQDLSGSVTGFAWSPSSTRVLVAVTDQFHVFSAAGGEFHGSVQVPQSLATKPAFVNFGATDDDICVFSSFGIRLTIINLVSSKAVEINNPKFFSTVSAPRGYSFRPGSRHLALLTRTSGRDMISIHSAETHEIQRSWNPETVDAQGLAWTPDGRWLVVWESPAHGTRVLLFTPDGHLFKEWRGGHQHSALNDMDQYGPGVRSIAFSPSGRYTAVIDGSPRICLINDRLAEEARLHHPQTIVPKETLQIWQEQIDPCARQRLLPTFVRATQAVSPPGLSSSNVSDIRYGCNLVKFDPSSSLLASRLDDAPSTIWIWDLPTSELRAVLMYHTPVTKVEWHPSQPELLLVKCEGERYSGIAFVWDPLSNGPRPIEFSRRLPGAKVTGRSDSIWLKSATESAALFCTDHENYVLVSLAETETDSDDEAVPWVKQVMTKPHANIDSQTDIDFLNKYPYDDDNNTDEDEDVSELDDTFQFKKSPIP
ncbi:hypothetical protein GGR50DRAFT_613379 [Xylaria sp. CBS 124048]|nr:hypothetical protein GGR50DRAFT_613379 [Xylaria sp. CBS 124048]